MKATLALTKEIHDDFFDGFIDFVHKGEAMYNFLAQLDNPMDKVPSGKHAQKKDRKEQTDKNDELTCILHRLLRIKEKKTFIGPTCVG